MYSLIVIDDEMEQLDGLVNYFPWEGLGFKIEASFEDGISAWKYLQDHDVDVVMTDIHLPFMSGLDLIEKIIEMKETPPLFCIMSAYSEFEYAKKAITFKVQEYLIKPASFQEITETFKKIKAELDKRNFTERTDRVENPIIDKVLEIITRDEGNCSLQSVADELRMNSAYLSRLFKEVKGENFHDFIIRTKMEKAARIIMSDVSYTNAELSAMLGYNDQQNFCRTFKKYHGTSPQQYRLQHKKEEKE